MIDATGFTAKRLDRNATLDRAHQIVADLLSQGLSQNPRIYADKFSAPGFMIPETATQDNSDLVTWATENYDGSTTLQSLGLPNDQPVYLAIFVVEGGNANFCYVGDIDAVMTNQGFTLKEAVNI